MSLRCPNCGREYDVTLFEFNREVTCACGERLSLKKGHEEKGSTKDGSIKDADRSRRKSSAP